MLNMLGVDICAYGFSGLGTGICALLTQILYSTLELICKLLGTFVDLLNIAFFIFAGLEFDGGRFNITSIESGESMTILDYFIFNETVTKSYLYLALIALVLVAVFTIYKIVKQDYFDKAGPRSKGPIFRNVAISCISFILVIPIFYLIIHASSLLAVQVMSAMGMDPDKYAGLRIFELSWSDNGKAMHLVNNTLANATEDIGSMWYLEYDIFFVMLADGDLVRYDVDAISKIGIGTWDGPLSTYTQTATLSDGSTVSNSLFYTNFYWYIYIVGCLVALKSLWNLALAMIQRIFKILGLFLVAPAPISQYVLDDGAKYKEWLKKSIEEGLRLVVAVMAFSIFLMTIGLVTDINFASAFSRSMEAASGGRSENLANVSASTLAYAGEFANIPTLSQAEPLVDGVMGEILPDSWQPGSAASYKSVGDYFSVAFGWTGIPELVDSISGTVDSFKAGCGLKGIRIVGGEPVCDLSFFEKLINAFLQCLLIVAAGGAIKDLDTVLSPLISGAQSSLDSGNTGGAVNAVGKAAVAVAGAVAGGVVSGVAGAVKGKEAAADGAKAGAEAEEKDAPDGAPAAGAPTEAGAPTATPPDDGGGDNGGDNGGSDDSAAAPEAAPEGGAEEGAAEGGSEEAAAPEGGAEEGAAEGGSEEAAAEGGSEEAAPEGGAEEGAAEGGSEEAAPEGGAEEGSAEGGSEEAAAPEGGAEGDKKPGEEGAEGDNKPGEEGAEGDKKPGEEGAEGDKKPGEGGTDGDKKPGEGGNDGDKKPGEGDKGGNKPAAGTSTPTDKPKKSSKIGKILKAPGKLAMRVGKGIGKAANSKVGSAVLGGLKGGLLAGLKSAGMQLASAYGLDGAVKGFKEAKESGDKSAAEAAKKKYDKAKNNTFIENRKQRMKQSNEQARTASTSYDQAVETARNAATVEGEKAETLNGAEAEVMRAEAEASAANSGILAGDKKLTEAQTQISENEALIQTARNDNKVILDTAGVSSYDELDSKISLLPKGSEERTKLEGLRDKFVPESQISEWQTQADTARATVAQRERMADTLTGRNGMLDKIGVGPDASFADVKTKAQEHATEAQKTIDSLEEARKDGPLTQAQQQQLAEARQMVQLNEDLQGATKADETYFGRKTVAEARTKNSALHAAQAKRDEAKQAYETAHAETESARSAMEDASKTYGEKVDMTRKLAKTAGMDENLGASTVAFDGKGGMTGWDKGLNKRREQFRRDIDDLLPGASDRIQTEIDSEKAKKRPNQRRIQKLEEERQRAIATGAGELSTQTVAAAASPKTVARVYDRCRTEIEDTYRDAGVTFAQGNAPSGKPMSEVLQGCEMAGTKGQYNINKVKKLIGPDSTLDEPTKQEVTRRLGVYERQTKDYHQQTRTIRSINATGQSIKTVDQRIEANTARGQVLAQESAIMQQVIASGGRVELTPQMTRIMNSVPGAHITSSSSSAEVLAAAKNARHQRMTEQASIATENQNLQAQANQLATALKGALGNIASELAGRAQPQQPQAQQPQAQQPQAQQPQQPQFATGTDTRAAAPVNFASQVKSPDQMNEAMYERMQTEMLRSNQEILNRVREQNKDILDTIERVEDEVKGD